MQELFSQGSASFGGGILCGSSVWRRKGSRASACGGDDAAQLLLEGAAAVGALADERVGAAAERGLEAVERAAAGERLRDLADADAGVRLALDDVHAVLREVGDLAGQRGGERGL